MFKIVKKWIQKASKGGIDLKSGRYLNIPENKTIPKTLLRKIKTAAIGSTITNPTKTGKRRIKVTRKLKQKALFAWNVNYV